MRYGKAIAHHSNPLLSAKIESLANKAFNLCKGPCGEQRGWAFDGALCKLLYSYLVVKLGHFPIDDYVKHW